jgi:hypothetical protein
VQVIDGCLATLPDSGANDRRWLAFAVHVTGEPVCF